jgi:hypothetical protein
VPHHSILRPYSALLLLLSFGLAGCSDDGDSATSGTGGASGASGSAGDSGSSGTAGDSGASGAGGESTASGYCGEDTAALVSGSGTPKNPAVPITETPVAGSTCNAVERQFQPEFGAHTPEPCVEIDYSTNPPCTGTHYGTWAAYRVYDEPIPRGFWVHSLEHGAVAFLYSCTDCADEVEAAVRVLDEAGSDPLCASRGSPMSLTLLGPDPRLDTRWAASAWGYTLTAECFEPEVFGAFLDAHRNLGPEIVCSDGVDVSQPPP